jgi:Uma2 family endonuclease
MSTVTDRMELEDRLRKPVRGEPVWPLAKRFPIQGSWTIDDYLSLVTERRVEYVDGCLEFLPAPTRLHQWIAGFLYRLLFSAIADHDFGCVYPAGYRVQVPERFREPDVVCILNRNAAKSYEQYAAADLVVEVVSPDDPDRDQVDKRAEYAAAGIPEYWIADPRDNTLTIFTLDDGATEYRQAGRWGVGETAASVLLEGLTVEVGKVFEGE